MCGRGGMADASDLGSGAVRCKSSSLFVRTIYAVVAQLVERHLATVEVASPSLVYRSIKKARENVLFYFSLLF